MGRCRRGYSPSLLNRCGRFHCGALVERPVHYVTWIVRGVFCHQFVVRKKNNVISTLIFAHESHGPASSPHIPGPLGLGSSQSSGDLRTFAMVLRKVSRRGLRTLQNLNKASLLYEIQQAGSANVGVRNMVCIIVIAEREERPVRPFGVDCSW